MCDVQKNFLEIKNRIDAINNNSTLVAVSKKQDVKKIRTLYDIGHRDFGENYAQDLIKRAQFFLNEGIKDIKWHFIGHMQTNKVRSILPLINTFHCLDSIKLANTLALEHKKQNLKPPLNVLIQVNIDNEVTKSGIAPQEVKKLAKEIQKHPELNLLGLMCIPNPDGNIQKSFIKLRKLEQTCRPSTKGALSMGMSDDFEIALKEGATILRIGTIIFGERSYSQ